MKHISLLLFLLCSISLFATEATDVSMMELNGPVKSYFKDGEKFYFDKSGNLTHAKVRTKHDVIVHWDEYYKHSFDKKGRRVKSKVYKDSTFKELLYSIKYKYDKKGVLIEKVTSQGVSTSYNAISKWEEVLSKYGNKKHQPNSEEKRTDKQVYDNKKFHLVVYDTTYCFYDEKGDLTFYIERGTWNETSNSRSYCRKVSSCGDTLMTRSISTKTNDTADYCTLTIVQNFRKIEEKEFRYGSSDSIDYIDKFKYNDHGLLAEKYMYRKNYDDYFPWTIHNIDCTITYQYDQLNNLVGEEWLYNDKKKTETKKYEIEYY